MSAARAVLILCFLLASVLVFAQRQRGELRLEVRDPAGGALVATVDLASDMNQLHRGAATDTGGRYAAQNLPFGPYRLSVSHEGFQTFTQVVRIGSEVPVHLVVTLGVTPTRTTVEVTDSGTLLDPQRTSTVHSIGSQSI